MEETEQAIRQIYDDYIADVIHLQATRKPTDGLMGFGKRADADPCHDRFVERLEQKLNEMAKVEPSSEETSAVLSFIYKAPQDLKNDSLTYWMLLAVHGLTSVLVPFLSKADAAKLSALYLDLYPKHSLLPSQKTLAQHLISQSGENKKKGLFRSK